MKFFSSGKKNVVGSAPEEANPFRRAVGVVPILKGWLPLPIVREANPEAQYMTQVYQLSPICFFNLKGANWDADGGSILKAD
jgi:hypothetical protein